MAEDQKDKLKRERPPYTILGKALIEDTQLTLPDLGVYWAICYHADTEGSSFPSYATIAKEARVCRRSAVQSVKNLITCGYLKKQPRKIDGKLERASNLYTVTNVYLHVKVIGSAPDAPPIGGSPDALPEVVHERNQGGARETLEQDSMNKKEEDLRKGTSKSRLVGGFCRRYKEKTARGPTSSRDIIGRQFGLWLKTYSEDEIDKVLDYFFGYEKRTQFGFDKFRGGFDNLAPRATGAIADNGNNTAVEDLSARRKREEAARDKV